MEISQIVVTLGIAFGVTLLGISCMFLAIKYLDKRIKKRHGKESTHPK